MSKPQDPMTVKTQRFFHFGSESSHFRVISTISQGPINMKINQVLPLWHLGSPPLGFDNTIFQEFGPAVVPEQIHVVVSKYEPDMLHDKTVFEVKE